MSLDPAAFDRRGEGVEISLVLIGVGDRELSHRPVEGVAGADVAADGAGVATAGVGAGQRPSAQLAVALEVVRGHAVDVEGALHVPELADVVLASGVGSQRPSQEDVGEGLHHPLADDNPLAVVGEGARAQVGLQHRRERLLDLEEQRIRSLVGAVAVEEADEAAGADTADADHLHRQVAEGVAADQVAPLLGDRLQIARHHAVELGDDLRVVVDPGHERRHVTDDVAPVDHLGELQQRLDAVVQPGPPGGALRRLCRRPPPPPGLIGEKPLDHAHVDRGVPDVEAAHARVLGEVLAVGACRGDGRDPSGVVRHVVGVGRHGQAGGQALEVPLPRSPYRLVEVVGTEDEPPLSRRVQPEVQQVGIAAELHVQPGHGRGGEVVGHHRRRPAVERERRGEHPPPADRDQLWDTRLVLGLEYRQRVRTGRRRAELGMGRSGRRATERPAGLSPLGGGSGGRPAIGRRGRQRQIDVLQDFDSLAAVGRARRRLGRNGHVDANASPPVAASTRCVSGLATEFARRAPSIQAQGRRIGGRFRRAETRDASSGQDNTISG